MEADSPSPDQLSLSPHWTAVHPALQEAPYDEEGWVSSGDEARDGTLVPGKDQPCRVGCEILPCVQWASFTSPVYVASAALSMHQHAADCCFLATRSHAPEA